MKFTFNKITTWAVPFILVITLIQIDARAQTDDTSNLNSGDKASTERGNSSLHPLFATEEILEMNLTMNFQELLRDRDEERDYHQAVLSYTDHNNKPVVIDLKVKVRGNNRRDSKVCGFPPLLLNFSSKNTANTLFSHQNKIKVVTNCRDDEYVLKEYLVYKLYNLISEKSFRVRLCKINYQNTQNNKISNSKYAFLIEDEDDMAERNKATLLADHILVRMDKADTKSMATLAVFQYMIGNTDWSVPYRHNIKIISLNPAMAPIPVPYDFDYAGIVGTPYAVPPPELGITSVRQRLFRGYCFTDQVFEEVIDQFNPLKNDIYQVYLNCDLLDQRYVKNTIKYLDAFYKTINNPKDFQHAFIRACQSNEKKSVVIKGLK